MRTKTKQAPLWCACAAVLSVLAGPALADRPRALDFDSMDTNADGYVSLSEWLVWFQEDIDNASPEAYGQARDSTIPVVRLKDAQGVEQTLIARPFAMGTADEADVLNDNFGEDRVESPIAARARMLRDQKMTRPFPDFESYDLDGDRRISREEMNRMVPVLANPIPPVEPPRR